MVKIPRNVVWLGYVSLFNDIASEMIYPIIPIFLTSVLGAPMAVVGMIEGAAESTASLLKVGSGWISDTIGKRKPLAVFGGARRADRRFDRRRIARCGLWLPPRDGHDRGDRGAADRGRTDGDLL